MFKRTQRTRCLGTQFNVLVNLGVAGRNREVYHRAQRQSHRHTLQAAPHVHRPVSPLAVVVVVVAVVSVVVATALEIIDCC